MAIMTDYINFVQQLINFYSPFNKNLFNGVVLIFEDVPSLVDFTKPALADHFGLQEGFAEFSVLQQWRTEKEAIVVASLGILEVYQAFLDQRWYFQRIVVILVRYYLHYRVSIR